MQISALHAAKGASIVDAEGNSFSIKAYGKTVVKGTSKYTITVTGSYDTNYALDEEVEDSTSLSTEN